MFATRLTPPRPFHTVLTSRGKGLQLAGASKPIALTKVTMGLTGAPGTQGLANISADAGNRIVLGSDNKLLVLPEGAPLSSPQLTWTGGRVTQVDYADGSVRALNYTAGRLVTNVLTPAGGAPVITKTYTYNPDGTLAAVDQS